MEGDRISLDWNNFGKYELAFSSESKSMQGNAIPKNEADDKNWRKAVFRGPLSAAELVLIGDGAGSEWEFEWSGGSFPVQFKADGYNHFKCNLFPAHAHWSLEDTKLRINWGEYGQYDLDVDSEAKTMEGAMVGGTPETDWRKAKFLHNLIDNKTVEKCEHHH